MRSIVATVLGGISRGSSGRMTTQLSRPRYVFLSGEARERGATTSAVPKPAGAVVRQVLNPDVPFITAQYLEFRGSLDHGLVTEAMLQAARDVESGFLFLADGDGIPEQFVDIEYVDDVPYVDCREFDDPEAAAHRWMTARFSAPLDPLGDRLIASTLLHIADNRYFLSSYVHHIALDGHGAMILLSRAAELYSAWIAGEGTPPVTSLPIEKIIEFETTYVGSKRQAGDREHWAQRLTDLPEPLSLIGDVAPLQSPRGDQELPSPPGSLRRSQHGGRK